MEKYTILLFGPAASLIDSDRVVVETSGAYTCDELKSKIITQHPALEMHIQVGRLAVNQGFVGSDDLIDSASEIALITMVSGG